MLTDNQIIFKKRTYSAGVSKTSDRLRFMDVTVIFWMSSCNNPDLDSVWKITWSRADLGGG